VTDIHVSVELKMMIRRISPLYLGVFFMFVQAVFAQNAYQVITVSDGGTISGVVKWAGPLPRRDEMPITKDVQICDPSSAKKAGLERLVIGPQGGVANAIVYLDDISRGKPMDLPVQRRFLDQKQCRYEPHILLVPQNAELKMKSSDATLHTVHMDGAATFNLPFPYTEQVISRTMQNPGLVNLKCNGGHVWMNAEMMVVSHPYYAVTDESGTYELTQVPPGTYRLVVWHEGWNVVGRENSFDVLTEQKVQRPVFTPPRTWDKHAEVKPNQTTAIDFNISNK
jgi:hypothetical protein